MYRVVTRTYDRTRLQAFLWFGTRLYVRDLLTLTLGAACGHWLF